MNRLLKDCILIVLIVGVFYSIQLGTRPFSTPDEGRYIEIAREMAVTGDFVTPRLDGVKYFEKPALMYWLQALTVKAFGVNEWVARAWTVFFSLMGILAVYLFTQAYFSRLTALGAAGILSLNIFYYAHSRIIILDMPVAVFITVALLSFYAACQSVEKRRKYLFGALFFACSALATLTKGLMSLAIPGMVILIWVGMTRRWQDLKIAFHPLGIALFFLIAAPWHIIVSLKNPDFAWFYFVQEHFLRFTTTVHGRYKPFWFFVPVLLVGLFPWVIFLFQSLKVSVEKMRLKLDSPETFLMIWAGFVFCFFSISSSKLIPYILPCVPPLSILMGSYVVTTYEQSKNSLRAGFITYGLCCFFLVVAIWGGLYREEMMQDQTILPIAYFLSFWLVFSGILSLFQKTNRGGILTVVFTSAVFFLSLQNAWPRLEDRSIKPLALEILKYYKPGDRIVGFHRYYQDLPPYTDQIIDVVGSKGEMTFGAEAEDTSDWMYWDETFWKKWNSDKRLFVVTRREGYDELVKKNTRHLHFIAECGRDVLFTNKPLDETK